MKPTNFLRILLLASALAGYSAWAVSVRERARDGQAGGPARNVIPLVRLDEAEALWRQGTTLFLDVRSAGDYEVGHVPGAVLMPEEEFEQRFPELKPRLERAKDLVVYCKSIDCGKSLWTAIRLRNAGLTQAKIYPAGWNEWYNRQRPVARGR